MAAQPAYDPALPAHALPAQDGVLLVNLGTPEAATPSAIRRYLRAFLSDRRVVELHPLLWWPILYAFILPLRPRRLAAKYAAIWTPGGSPLLAIGRQQAEGVAIQLAALRGRPVPVALAMRYGAAPVSEGIAQLEAQGVRRIAVLPLFPQYSATTTAAVLDAVFDAVRARRWLPELRTVNSYHDDSGYIAALAASVRAHWAVQGRGEHLLMSFHGIPRRYHDAGDPYPCHCRKTARLLAEALQLPDGAWSLAYQSRFGKAEWLKPYVSEHLPALAARGIRTLDVIAPGFAADCLETLEEISDEYGTAFAALGGQLRYIAALNDSTAHCAALAQLAANALQNGTMVNDHPAAV